MSQEADDIISIQLSSNAQTTKKYWMPVNSTTFQKHHGPFYRLAARKILKFDRKNKKSAFLPWYTTHLSSPQRSTIFSNVLYSSTLKTLCNPLPHLSALINWLHYKYGPPTIFISKSQNLSWHYFLKWFIIICRNQYLSSYSSCQDKLCLVYGLRKQFLRRVLHVSHPKLALA